MATKKYIDLGGHNVLGAQEVSGGGSGTPGTTDYNALSNQPSIGGVTLTGNKTAAELGLATTADIGSVFIYKGSVANYAALPTTGMVIGWTYNVQAADATHGVNAGDNLCWNGTDWDVLAGTVDLSDYATNTNVTAAITPINTVLGNKVDKETGKGLSTNDFTNEYKSKIDGMDSANFVKYDFSNPAHFVDPPAIGVYQTVKDELDDDKVKTSIIATGIDITSVDKLLFVYQRTETDADNTEIFIFRATYEGVSYEYKLNHLDDFIMYGRCQNAMYYPGIGLPGCSFFEKQYYYASDMISDSDEDSVIVDKQYVNNKISNSKEIVFGYYKPSTGEFYEDAAMTAAKLITGDVDKLYVARNADDRGVIGTYQYNGSSYIRNDNEYTLFFNALTPKADKTSIHYFIYDDEAERDATTGHIDGDLCTVVHSVEFVSAGDVSAGDVIRKARINKITTALPYTDPASAGGTKTIKFLADSHPLSNISTFVFTYDASGVIKKIAFGAGITLYDGTPAIPTWNSAFVAYVEKAIVTATQTTSTDATYGVALQASDITLLGEEFSGWLQLADTMVTNKVYHYENGAWAEWPDLSGLFDGDYNSLTNKPAIPNALTAGTNITITDNGDGSSTVSSTATATTVSRADASMNVTKTGDNYAIKVNIATAAVLGGVKAETATPDDTQEVRINAATGKLLTKAVVTDTASLTNGAGFVTNAVNDLANYYLKTETYTQAQVNALIAAITTLTIEKVTALPTTGISTMKIYLLPKTSASSQNAYEEYINTDGTAAGWEVIGDTEIDLSNYATITQLDAKLDKSFYEGVNEVASLAGLPVDKRNILCTVSSATALSLSSDLQTGQDLYIRVVPGADFTQDIPDTADWFPLGDKSYDAKAGEGFEISVWCFKDDSGTKKYSVKLIIPQSSEMTTLLNNITSSLNALRTEVANKNKVDSVTLTGDGATTTFVVNTPSLTGGTVAVIPNADNASTSDYSTYGVAMTAVDNTNKQVTFTTASVIPSGTTIDINILIMN